VELRLRGENTELDKIVLEKIGDPLVHLSKLPRPRPREPGGPDRVRQERNRSARAQCVSPGRQRHHRVKDDGAGLDCTKILAKRASGICSRMMPS